MCSTIPAHRMDMESPLISCSTEKRKPYNDGEVSEFTCLLKLPMFSIVALQVIEYLNAWEILMTASTCSSVRNSLLRWIENNICFSNTFTTLTPAVLLMEYGSRRPHVQHLKKLPRNLKILIMDHKYNLPLSHLPPTLLVLYLGCNYSLSLDTLPTSLRELHIGTSFTGHLDHLPHGLQILEIAGFFNHSLDKLPGRLTRLTIGGSYNGPLDKLPASLLYLSITSFSFNQSLRHLPSGLLELRVVSECFSQDLVDLPAQLRSLTIESIYFDNKVELPPSLENYVVASVRNQQLHTLPTSLRSLRFKGAKVGPLNCTLPTLSRLHNLEILELPVNYTHAEEFPASLKILYLGELYNHPINHLPRLEEIAYCSRNFRQSITHLPKLRSVKIDGRIWFIDEEEFDMFGYKCI